MKHLIRREIMHILLRSEFRFPLSFEQKQARNSPIGQFRWSEGLLGKRKTEFRSYQVVQNFTADQVVHPARLWHTFPGRSFISIIDFRKHRNWSNVLIVATHSYTRRYTQDRQTDTCSAVRNSKLCCVSSFWMSEPLQPTFTRLNADITCIAACV
jgi:hypothetical protein